MERGVRMIAIKFGIFGLIAILLFAALYNTMTNKVEGGTKTLYASFPNVSRLRSGHDVRISGVKVGRRQGLTAQDHHLARAEYTAQRKHAETDKKYEKRPE